MNTPRSFIYAEFKTGNVISPFHSGQDWERIESPSNNITRIGREERQP